MKPKNVITETELARQPAAAGLPAWWPRRLTRGQVAAELETSIASVRRMEGRTLHPVRGEDGNWGFDPAEVAARKPCDRADAPKGKTSPEGELAAAAFRLFNEGHGFRQAVTELRLPPEFVRALYREWHEDGDLWIPRDLLGWLREAFAASFPDERRLTRIRRAADLVALLEMTFDYADELHETLAERNKLIKDLEQANQKLKTRVEELRAQPAPAIAASGSSHETALTGARSVG